MNSHVRETNRTRCQFMRMRMAEGAGLEPAKPFFRPDALATRSLIRSDTFPMKIGGCRFALSTEGFYHRNRLRAHVVIAG